MRNVRGNVNTSDIRFFCIFAHNLPYMWRFKPILKPTIWGGSRIAAFKGEAESSAADAHIGETYELSGMPGHESVVAAGPDKGLSLTGLIERYGVALLGRKNLERTGLE